MSAFLHPKYAEIAFKIVESNVVPLEKVTRFIIGYDGRLEMGEADPTAVVFEWMDYTNSSGSAQAKFCDNITFKFWCMFSRMTYVYALVHLQKLL